MNRLGEVCARLVHVASAHHIKDFRRNWSNTLIVALIAVGIQYFGMVGIVLFIAGVFFTIMYSLLVSSYMFGALSLERPQEGVVTHDQPAPV